MTDLSTLSDADLAKAYQQSLGGGAAPTPEGFTGTRMTVGGPDPSKMSDDELQAAYEKHAPDPAGLAKQGGIGIAKGVIGIPAIPGDVRRMVDTAAPAVVGWVARKLGVPEDQAAKFEQGTTDALSKSPRALPTSDEIQHGVEAVTGEFRKPQNQAEADAQTVGEFLPAAVTGPGSLARKVILQDALPAASTIVAGRYSDQNPYVKALAGFLAGGAGALASGPSSANQIVRSKIPASVTVEHITRAGQLIAHAEARGVALTWPEALTRVTGQPVLTDMQRVLESHGQTRHVMNDFFADRPGEVARAADAEFGRLGGVHPNPNSLGADAATASEAIIGRVRGAINQATRPSYDAARQSLVPTQVHAAMMSDPLFEQALNAVRNDPARNSFIRGLSDRSTVVYDAVKQELRERSTNLANPVQQGHSHTASAATGTLAGDVSNIAVAADRHAIGLAPGQGTGNLERALAEQARLREQYLGPLQRGPLGRIIETDGDTKNVVNALFPKSPIPHSQDGIGGITTAVGALVAHRPAVAEQLVRAHAEMTFNEAARELQGGASHFAGAKFAKVIAGNSQQRANLRAAVEALPNGAVRWQGFEHLLDIMSATGARPPRGSLTAFNDLDVKSMSSAGFAEIASKAASPGKYMTAANDAFKVWSLGRNLDQLARLITDPRAGNAFNQIIRIPARSDRAVMMVGRLLNVLGAVTAEQRNQPAQGNRH